MIRNRKRLPAGMAPAIGVALFASFFTRAPAAECGSGLLQVDYWIGCTPWKARPGDGLAVSFSVSSTHPLEAVDFFLRYDPVSLEILGHQLTYSRSDGLPLEAEGLELSGPGEEEGWIRGGLVFGAGGSPPASPESKTALYEFQFRIRPDTLAREGGLGYHLPDRLSEGVEDNFARTCGVEVRHGSRNGNLWLHGGGPNITQPGDCDWDLPETLTLSYRLGDAVGTPGGALKVPLSIAANEVIQGYVYSIDYDEEVLQATLIEPTYPEDNSGRMFLRHEIHHSNDTTGSAGVDEGYLAGAVVFDTEGQRGAIPAGMETEVLRFHFLVQPQAASGTTELRFQDGGKGYGEWGQGGLFNGAVVCGSSMNAETARSFVFLNGRVGVIDEVTVFLRGDSNGDLRVDVSDPIATLGFLYTGGDRPPCYDAADANDDGSIDLSDAVTTFAHLFTGERSIPPPSGIAGEDPTPDALGCLSIHPPSTGP